MVERVVVCGVSGSGKSTIGRALAAALGVPFEEGDDLHSPANLAKMSAGHPLDDADRAPWLAAVAQWLADQSDGGLISCSALKRSYRDAIRAVAPDAYFLQLDGDTQLLRRRQAHRPGHFMPATLMPSQLSAFEPLQPDEDGAVLDVGGEPATVLAAAVTLLRRR